MRLAAESWNDDAERALKRSAGPDMAQIRAEVQQGMAGLYRCEAGGQLDGRVVLRLEGTELVIVLGEGRNAKKWAGIIEDYARHIGATTLRTHIQRRGLKRIYEGIGWKQREIVMGKTL